MRDIVATLIYGVALAAQFFIWSWWQKRGKKAEQPAIAAVLGLRSPAGAPTMSREEGCHGPD